MSGSALVLGLYCALVLLASLAGGWLLIVTRLTHTRLQMLVSFVAGLMLGMALLHLIPHAYFQLNSLDRTMTWTLCGFLAMFFVQRFFHFHHHDLPDQDPEDCCHGADSRQEEPEHKHHAHTLAEKSAMQLSWSGTAIGLGLHSLLDGIALAAAVAAEAGHGGLIAFGTALAIILHKPFDAMAVSTLMARSGSSRAQRHLLNALFALIAPAGVVLFCFGASQFGSSEQVFIGSALAFCGGVFLCISCSDLLPELQFHSHDRLWLSAALAGGLAVAVFIGGFETSGHDRHGHEQAPVPHQAE